MPAGGDPPQCLRLQRGEERALAEVADARLRGRGGAGFPTATKWRSVRDAPGTDKYVVANGAEGEPATFKDRTVMRFCPYEVIEGAAIAALVVDAVGIYVVAKRSFTREVERLRAAVSELESAGLVGDVPIIFALAGVLLWLHPWRWPDPAVPAGVKSPA